MDKKKGAFVVAAGLAIVAASLEVVWRVALPWSWMWVALLLLFFMLILGSAISGRLLGILITEQNTMSLARFQAVLWTIIIISAFFVIAVARVNHGVQSADGKAADPLNIALSNELLALVGISVTSLVGSPLIAGMKKTKTPDNTDLQISTGDKSGSDQKTNAAPATNVGKSEGILFKNADVRDARFTDIFEGDELANNNHVDLGKVQMFYFTVIVAVAYITVLWQTISTPALLYSANFTFPALSAGAVSLLGISNAGYLANKGVDHTKKTPT